MAFAESIIVVTQPKMAKVGRALVHGITINEKIKASLYTLKQYKHNENQITGRQPVIFFGKNEVSESYIEGMHVEYAKYGIKWGWNGPKAMVFIEYTPDDENERMDFKEEFYQFKKDIAKHLALQEERKQKKKEKEETDKAPWYFGVIGIVMFKRVLPPIFIWILGKKIFISKEIRKMQMQYAIALFLRDGLSKYIKQLSE